MAKDGMADSTQGFAQSVCNVIAYRVRKAACIRVSSACTHHPAQVYAVAIAPTVRCVGEIQSGANDTMPITYWAAMPRKKSRTVRLGSIGAAHVLNRLEKSPLLFW